MRAAALAVLALCAAMAPDQPNLRPTRDVAIVYRTDGPQPMQQTVRWLVAAQRMRIDPPTPGLFVIIDYLARRMSVVRIAEKSVLDMTAPDDMADAVAGGASSRFLREGETTVAGLPCTEWQTKDRAAHDTLLCITADGVLLRADTNGRTMVTAASVDYAPQNPADFRVPADFAHRSVGAVQ